MNIDTRHDLLQGAQKQQQAQKTQSTQALSRVQAAENQETQTETVDAVKAPRYDTVKIDEQGYDALASSLAAQQSLPQAPVPEQDTPDASLPVKAAQPSQTDQMSGAAQSGGISQLTQITAKMQSGQTISPSELDFLRENSPADYARAIKASQGGTQIEKTEENISPQKIQAQQAKVMSMSMPTE